MSNPYLDQVREELRAAKRDVERARVAYNQKLDVFKKQKARYERLEFLEMERQFEIARARDEALANGDHALAALLVATVPPRP